MTDTPSIVVCGRLEDDLQRRLERIGEVRSTAVDASPDEKIAASSGAVGLMVMGHTTTVDRRFLESAPDLRVVSTASVGYDHIDLAEAARRRIVVTHTPDVVNRPMVDLTMVMVVALARRLFENHAFARSGRWSAGARPPSLGFEISGRTLGIVGMGRIGQEVARRMKALGMRILWFARNPDRVSVCKEGYRRMEDLLEESDFVSLHANLEPGSPPIMGAREFDRMKATAYLVNTARGGLVDQQALFSALKGGTIAGAALDVLASEPPDSREPILSLPNVICLPHIGTATTETRRAMREMATENLVRGLAGDPPLAPVPVP